MDYLLDAMPNSSRAPTPRDALCNYRLVGVDGAVGLWFPLVAKARCSKMLGVWLSRVEPIALGEPFEQVRIVWQQEA